MNKILLPLFAVSLAFTSCGDQSKDAPPQSELTAKDEELVKLLNEQITSEVERLNHYAVMHERSVSYLPELKADLAKLKAENAKLKAENVDKMKLEMQVNFLSAVQNDVDNARRGYLEHSKVFTEKVAKVRAINPTFVAPIVKTID